MLLDWPQITEQAYAEWLKISGGHFPLDPTVTIIEGVKVFSYKEIAAMSGRNPESVKQALSGRDSFVETGLIDGVSIIIYDSDRHRPRVMQSIWHEVGHIRMGHGDDGPLEEIEANFFASQVRAPDVILREIVHRGYMLNDRLLREYFGLSREAATRKRRHIETVRLAPTEYDEEISARCEFYIAMNFPKRNKENPPIPEREEYEPSLAPDEPSTYPSRTRSVYTASELRAAMAEYV